MNGTRPYLLGRLAPVLLTPATLVAFAVPMVARAAVPPVVARLERVMGAAHSYRQIMVLTSSGGPTGASTIRIDLVAVRHGTALEEYIRTTQQGAEGPANQH